MHITEGEMVVLIHESINGKSVSYKFGPGWCAIDTTIESNAWAMDRVEEMRTIQGEES
jgi:hypothetical protein